MGQGHQGQQPEARLRTVSPRDLPAALPPALDRTLTWRLHKLHKLSDRDSQAAYLADVGLQLGEARCLGAVGSFGPLSIVDLARQSNLDKGQASRAAQGLVDKGLVRKQTSPSDGRGVVLTLTRRGGQAWRKLMQVIARRNEEIFGCLDAAEQEQLGRLFDRVIAAGGVIAERRTR